MNLKPKYILLFIILFLLPKAKTAEEIFLYKGTFNRSFKIEELYQFILFESVENIEDWRRGVPGEPLSIAISSLIVWSITLRRLINLIGKKTN